MNEILIFDSGDQIVRVRLEGETVWLTQAQMAELFATSTDNISLHLKNIFADKELDEFSTTEEFSVVRQEGKRQVRRRLRHYNLDAIISLGSLTVFGTPAYPTIETKAAHLLYFVIKITRLLTVTSAVERFFALIFWHATADSFVTANQ